MELINYSDMEFEDKISIIAWILIIIIPVVCLLIFGVKVMVLSFLIVAFVRFTMWMFETKTEED